MRWLPFIVSSVIASGASATTLRVPQNFATIQDAVDAAGPDDTIKIAKGTYFENVVVPAGKDGLTIRGAGKGTIVDARPFGPFGSGAAIDATGDRLTIVNLTVRFAAGFNPFGMVLIGDHATIRGVKALTCAGFGIGVAGNDPRVEQCEVRGCERGVIVDGARARVRKVTVHNAIEDGILVGTIDGSVRQCRVLNSGESGIAVLGENLVVEKNVVENSLDDALIVDCSGDVTVRSNKVLRAAGTNGAIAVGSATSGVIAKNVATDCNVAALYLASTLTGVKATANRGLRCGATTGSTFVVDCTECVLIGNRAIDGNGDGFAVGGLTNVLHENVALRCAMDGFDIDAASSFSANVARSNHAEGFDIAVLGVELVGNVARKNRTDITSSVAIDVFVSNHFGTGGDGVAPEIDD